MVKLTVGTNTKKADPVIVEASKTVVDILKDFQEKTGFDYNRGQWHMNGERLAYEDYSKTLEELDADGKTVYLLNVAKAENA